VMLLHPSGLSLSRFADRELTGWRERAVARHVEKCARCQEYVAFIHQLAATMDEPAGNESPGTPVEGSLSEKVIRRRRAGERVALWTPDGMGNAGDPERASGWRRSGTSWRLGVGIAASFILLALAGVYLFEAPPAAAGHSQLQFAPELPTPGATVDVRYTPAFHLADFDSLRLRVRSRTEDTPYPRRSGVIGDLRTITLRRTDDGTFVGRLRIEPGEVFVAAAVEDFSGQDVDTNLGRLWDILVATPSGEPSIEALESRYRVLEANNSVQAVGWAKEITERYPQNPFGWSLLRLNQTRLGPFPMPDSLAALHDAKLRELIADQSGRPENVDEVIALFNYARWNDDTRLSDSLIAEVERLDPRNHAVLEWRSFRLLHATPAEPKAYLREIEPLWTKSDRSSDYVVLAALLKAGQAADEPAVRRWIDRGLRLPSLNPGVIAARLDRFDFAAAERARLRRDRLRALEATGDESRPLNETVPESLTSRQEEIRQVQAHLALDLTVTGDTTEALALFREATRDAWQPDLLQPYADLLLATGDTTTALPLVGLLAADPVSGSEFSSHYRTLLEARVSDPIAFGLRSATELRRRVRSTPWLGRHLPGRTPLHLANGTTMSAEDILAGAPSIIVFFEPDVTGIAEQLAAMRRRALETLQESVHLLFVAKTASREAARLIPHHQLVVDPEQNVAQFLHEFSANGSVVLDADLTVSVRAPDFDSALRIAGSL